MLTERLNFIQVGNRTDPIMMKARDIKNLTSIPAANQPPVQREVVRRGEKLMVVFKGCPPSAEVQQLLNAGVHIGLALSSDDLQDVPKLDHFSYVFAAVGPNRRCPLKRAIADLASNGWTLDDDEVPEVVPIKPHVPKAPIRSAALAVVQG